MSHFTELKVNALVKNEADLIATLENHFGEGSVEVSDTLLGLSGYDREAGKQAHIKVKKDFVAKANGGYAYNDLGYERQSDGTYLLHADPVDFRQDAQQKVAQDYAQRVATRKLKSMGYSYKTVKDAEGRIVISATSMGKYGKG
jgi:hypothetical protein